MLPQYYFFFSKKFQYSIYSVEIQLFLLPLQNTRNIKLSQTNILLKTYVLNIKYTIVDIKIQNSIVTRVPNHF